MQPEPELQTIVNLRYAKEREEINQKVQQLRIAKKAELQRRGLEMSGAAGKLQIELTVTQIRENCEALAGIWVDVFRRKHGSVTQEQVAFIGGQITEIVAGSRDGGISALWPNHRLPDALATSLKQQLSGELSSIEAGIKRDLELMRREQDELPPVAAAASPVTNIYHLNGHGSRFNINSNDSSINHIVVNDSELFEGLRQTISSAALEDSIRTALLSGVAELETAKGQPSFLQKYVAFMSTAADHMTLLAPFIPALSSLLQ